MRSCLALLMLMLFATPALAAHKCPKPCNHKVVRSAPRHSVVTPVPTPFEQLVSGLELRAGARWENETSKRKHEDVNPFYVGAGFGMPLNDSFKLYGGVNYRFETSDWQPQVELSFSPAKR